MHAPARTAPVPRALLTSTQRDRYERVIQPYAPCADTDGGPSELPSRVHGAPRQRMTTQNGRAFNEWLRAQLKAKKMSQRQLAQQSGVDHSTISRLIRGDRMPSLGTATKLARGLRELHDDADTPAYLGLVSSAPQNPPRASSTRSAPTTS